MWKILPLLIMWGGGFGGDTSFGGGSFSGKSTIVAVDAGAGYSQLPVTFTLNSVTPTAKFIFRGRDATLTNWPELSALDTMPVIGAGADPIVGVASPFPNPFDRVVSFNTAIGDKYYQSATTTFGNIGTDDFVFEVIFMTPAGASWPAMVAKKTSAASGVSGWRFTGVPASFRTNFFMRSDPTGNVSVQNTGAQYTNGQYHHVMVFADRSGNARIYRDGVLLNSISILTLDTLSLSGTDPFALGATSNQVSAGPGPGFLAWTAMWEAANLCGGTTADQDALALARFNLLGL